MNERSRSAPARFLDRLATPMAFLLPALVLLFAFRLAPALVGLSDSLFAAKVGAPTKDFVGLANYARLAGDPGFQQSLKVTLLFNVVVNPLQTGLAFGLALLLNQRLPGIGVFRTIMLIPIAISLNISSAVWLIMYDPSGLYNGILVALGLPAQPFLRDAAQAIWAIAALASWVGVPLWSLFFLAGLQGISAEVEEAATVDGAGRWHRLRFITVPLLRPVFVFVLASATVANFLLFVPVLLLTQGGPQQSTNVLMFDAYRRGLLFGDTGTASAIVVLIMALAAIAVSVTLRRGRDS